MRKCCINDCSSIELDSERHLFEYALRISTFTNNKNIENNYTNKKLYMKICIVIC